MTTIASHLDDCFRLLVGGPRTALPRQRTLRAALDWSYALLTVPERVLLRRLTVFVGGWTLEAVELVCSDPLPDQLESSPDQVFSYEMIDVLASLAAKSLIQQEAGEDGVRFHMLEPVRQYAAEMLGNAGEAVALHDRHLHWALTLSGEAESSLSHGPGQAPWIARLRREHDNLQAALTWAIDQHQVEPGLVLAGRLHRYWTERGHLREGYSFLRALLATPNVAEVVPVPLRARALYEAAFMARRLEDCEQARQLGEESLALHRQCDELRASAVICINILGLVAMAQDDLTTAAERFNQCLALEAEQGNKPAHVGTLLANLGVVSLLQEDYPRALSYGQEAALLLRGAGDMVNLSLALLLMGLAHVDMCDAESAAPYMEESLLVAQDLDLALRKGLAQLGLAIVLCCREQDAAAAQLMHEGLSVLRRSGERAMGVVILSSLPPSLAARHHPETATLLYGALAADHQRHRCSEAVPYMARLHRRMRPVADVLSERAFSDLLARGQTMVLDEAIDAVLPCAQD